MASQQEIADEIQALKEKAKVKNIHLIAIGARVEELEARSREEGRNERSEVDDGDLLRYFPSRNEHHNGKNIEMEDT